ALSSPGEPLHALALPALKTTACAVGCVVSRSRLRTTGAAGKLFWVNVATATHGASEAHMPRSGLPEALIPAATAPARKPLADVDEPSLSMANGFESEAVMASSAPSRARAARQSQASGSCSAPLGPPRLCRDCR